MIWTYWDSILRPERNADENRQPTMDIHLDLADGFTSCWLYPGAFLLVATIEEFHVPDDVLLTVHDRSTLARQGVLVGNTVIQPGSRGFQTIEMWNRGREAVPLYKGMAIAQLVQHEVPRQVPSYAGRYQDQTRGPHGPR